MHFLAKLELQFVWDLVVNLSEEIEKCKSVTSELRKLKSLDTKKKQTLPLGKKKKTKPKPSTGDILCEIFWPFKTQAHLFLSLLSGLLSLALLMWPLYTR